MLSYPGWSGAVICMPAGRLSDKFGLMVSP
jgi:hypothetical protein